MPGTTRFLRIHDVMDMTKLGKTTIYRKMAAHEFPKPMVLSTACVRWREEDVQDWMSSFVPSSSVLARQHPD